MPYMTMDKADLPNLAKALAGQDKRLVLPVKEDQELFYREGSAPEAMDLTTLPKNSIKEFLFPKSEKILKYQYHGNDVTLEDIDSPAEPTVIFGARPCDAASLPIVEPLWNWDYKDNFFNQRREQTLVVTYACRQAPDEACFCTAVGLNPGSDQGADIMLYQLDDSRVAVSLISSAGQSVEAIVAPFKKGEVDDAALNSFREEGDKSLAHRKPLDKVKDWLGTHFEDPVWEEKTFPCIGCGTCTFLCPTCHCFDIQDEGVFDSGARVKNWDGCQFPLFTLHTSGHNPRDTQPKRYRQRILHKYFIYPQKFGKILCTGCGRCVASCPVNLSLYDVVATVQEKAEKGE